MPGNETPFPLQKPFAGMARSYAGKRFTSERASNPYQTTRRSQARRIKTS